MDNQEVPAQEKAMQEKKCQMFAYGMAMARSFISTKL